MFALAVYHGVVREVYEIERWYRDGDSHLKLDPKFHPKPVIKDRWGFVGRVAPEPFHRRYYGKSVARFFKPGQQSPLVYLNC